jgi:hypothetical protein
VKPLPQYLQLYFLFTPSPRVKLFAPSTSSATRLSMRQSIANPILKRTNTKERKIMKNDFHYNMWDGNAIRKKYNRHKMHNA